MAEISKPSPKYRFRLMHQFPECTLPDGTTIRLTASAPFFILAHLVDLADSSERAFDRDLIRKQQGYDKKQLGDNLNQLRRPNKNPGCFHEILPNNGEHGKITIRGDLIEVDTHIFHLNHNHILNDKEEAVKSLDDKILSSLLNRYGGPFLGNLKANGNVPLMEWLTQRRATLRRLIAMVMVEYLNRLVDRKAFTEALATLKSLYQRDPMAINGKLAHYWVWLGAKLRQSKEWQDGLTRLVAAQSDGHDDSPMDAKEWREFLRYSDFHQRLTIQLLRGEYKAQGLDASLELREPGSLAEKICTGARSNGSSVICVQGAPGSGKTHFINRVIECLTGYGNLYVARLDLSAGQDDDVLVAEAFMQWGGAIPSEVFHTAASRKKLLTHSSFGDYVLICDGMTDQSPSPEHLQALFEGAQVVAVCDTLPSSRVSLSRLIWPVQPMMTHEVRDFMIGQGSDDSQPRLKLGWEHDSPRWHELTDATGGHPLVLEMLAGVINTRRPHTAELCLKHFMRAVGSVAPGGHYHAFLTWLFGNDSSPLTSNDRWVLVAASQFAGPADTVSAEGLKTVSNLKQEMIDHAVTCHLLKPVKGPDDNIIAYKLHRVLREYLRAQSPIAPNFTAELRASYIAYMQQYIDTTLSDPETSYYQLNAMRADVLRMFDHVLANQPSGEDLARLVTLYNYFDQRGLYLEAQRLYTAALAALTSGNETTINLLLCRGQALLKQGKVDEALEDLKQARSLASGVGGILEARICRDYGRVMMIAGRYPDAYRVLQEGMEITNQKLKQESSEETAFFWLIGQHIYANLAVIHQEQGDYPNALHYLSQLVLAPDDLAPFISARDADVIEQFKLNLLGLIESERPNGDMALAESYLQNALELATRLRIPERRARTRLNLGVLAYLNGYSDEALGFFADARQDIANTGHHELLVWLTFNEAMVALMQGDLGTADKKLIQVHYRIYSLNLHHIKPHALIGSGIYYLMKTDKHDNAIDSFKEALAATDNPSVMHKPQTITRVLYGLALVQVMSRNHHQQVNPKNIMTYLGGPDAQPMLDALRALSKRNSIDPSVEVQQAHRYYTILMSESNKLLVDILRDTLVEILSR